mmetsp:Transcript_57142/g.156924  ORF Transcript_57142/g.156924 Transcript_57142/m.156924 type:complete len:213 (+) Transcript_57142:757-1395(+)
MRWLRRAASRLQALARTGDLPLHLGLHIQDGGHGGRHHKADRRLLGVLRRAVSRVAPRQVRHDARRQARAAPGDRVAAQHRVGRRRQGQALPTQVHARHRRRDPLGRARAGAVQDRPDLPPLAPGDVPRRARRAARPVECVGRPGRVQADAVRPRRPLREELCQVRRAVHARGDRAGAGQPRVPRRLRRVTHPSPEARTSHRLRGSLVRLRW